MLTFVLLTLFDCSTAAHVSNAAATISEGSPLLMGALLLPALIAIVVIVTVLFGGDRRAETVAKASRDIKKTAKAGRRAIDDEFDLYVSQLHKTMRK